MNYRKQNSNGDRQPSLTAEQIKSTISFLNRSFREASEEYRARAGSNSNVRGSVLYDYQVEFSYLIDNIQRGPVFFAIQHIAEANELIGKLQKH